MGQGSSISNSRPYPLSLEYIGLLTTTLNRITSILISRFILELRLVDFQSDHREISASSFINFAIRTVGSLGAPLDESARTTWNDPDFDEEGLEADPESLSVVSVPELKM